MEHIPKYGPEGQVYSEKQAVEAFGGPWSLSAEEHLTAKKHLFIFIVAILLDKYTSHGRMSLKLF